MLIVRLVQVALKNYCIPIIDFGIGYTFCTYEEDTLDIPLTFGIITKFHMTLFLDFIKALFKANLIICIRFFFYVSLLHYT